MFSIRNEAGIIIKSNLSGMFARQLMVALREAGEFTRLFDCMDTFVISSDKLPSVH